MEKQTEGNQNIKLGLVIGDDHILRIFSVVFPSGNQDRPGRHYPEVHGSPKTGELVKQSEAGIECNCENPYGKGNEKKKDRGKRDKDKKGD